MRTEKQILELRAEVDTAQRAILNRARDEKRALNADEDAQWQKADQDFQALTKELEMVRGIAQRDADFKAATEEFEQTRGPISKSEKETNDAKYKAFFRRLLTGEGLTESEALRMAQDPVRTQTTTVSGNGNYLVPEEFIRMLEVVRKQYGGMFQAAKRHSSAKGGVMNWPTFDSTDRTGTWQDQPRTVGLTPQAFTFNRKQFSAFLWTDLALLTWEFIQDEDVSFVSQHLAEAFGASSGRAMNKAFTDGDGVGTPTGILDATNGAVMGKEAASQTAITKQELIDLIHSVDPAYRNGPNEAFMFNDALLAYIRKLDYGTTDDQPVWQPSMQAGEPDRILGKRYVINQDFPATIAQGAKIIAFGDWSKYIIRDVKDFSLIRLNERYADQLATGFLAWQRVDGKLLQPAAIKLLVAKTT